MVDRGYEFWKIVDKLRGDTGLIEFADNVGINYRTMLNQRSENRIPKKEQLIKIADKYGVSVGYLLGTEQNNTIITPEMAFVRDNEAARMLIKKFMDNPSLLEHVSALVVLLEPEVVNMQKQA